MPFFEVEERALGNRENQAAVEVMGRRFLHRRSKCPGDATPSVYQGGHSDGGQRIEDIRQAQGLVVDQA